MAALGRPIAVGIAAARISDTVGNQQLASGRGGGVGMRVNGLIPVIVSGGAVV
jgi:hypothetical protein